MGTLPAISGTIALLSDISAGVPVDGITIDFNTAGQLEVIGIPGIFLEELLDVDYGTNDPTDGDILVFNGNTNVWEIGASRPVQVLSKDDKRCDRTK